MKTQLQEVAKNLHDQDSLKQVEHFHNQFHIQLINIHDIKHAIRTHEQQVEQESANGKLSEAIYSRQESLQEEYLALERTFDELKNEFSGFIRENQ